MAINKNRSRKPKTETPEFEEFVAQGGTVPEAPPAPKKPQTPTKRASNPSAPAWVERAETAKKTEAQPFRYNKDQQRLLEHAKQVEGRDYSKILADIVWPALEEKYGAEVPFD